MGAFPTNITLSVESAIVLLRVLRYHTRGGALTETSGAVFTALHRLDDKYVQINYIHPYDGYVTSPDYPHGALLITRGAQPETPQFVTIRVPRQEVILLTRLFRWHVVGDGLRDIYDTLIGTLVEMKVGTGDVKPLFRYHYSDRQLLQDAYFVAIPGYLTGKVGLP